MVVHCMIGIQQLLLLLLPQMQVLVMSGALLYVFSKGAKFSLFKPAEEMVYITLDEDGRTRGKAAIDVVGSQVMHSLLLLLLLEFVQPAWCAAHNLHMNMYTHESVKPFCTSCMR